MSKKQHFLIFIEAALIFLFIFLLSSRQVRPFYSIIGFLLASIVLNFFIFRYHQKRHYFIILSSLFFTALVFFQVLIDERLINIVAALSAVLFLTLTEGLALGGLPRAKSESNFHILVQVYSLATLLFWVHDIFTVRLLFPFSSAVILTPLLVGTLAIYGINIKLSLGSFREHREIALAGSALLIEFCLILYFAPLSILAKSSLLAILYYAFFGMVELLKLPIIDKRKLKLYIGIALTTTALTLLMSRWR